MRRTIRARRRFAGPYWVAVALLDIEPDELVTPELRELEARVTRSTGVTRRVEVEHGALVKSSGHASMELRWRDADRSVALPEMLAELRLIDEGDDTTGFELVGTYQPPFGVLGALFDALIGRWFAQRTVDRTAQRLATRFEAAVHARITTFDPPPNPPSSDDA